ncbi:cell surface protein [Corynebacterium renale]|uniref:hypothetical protein n=1 Tax=Corynebacterium renale TaxID=1724 RepID=UPI000DA2D5D2|nr:hypothetical protein [Corynebacterium renale]SQG63999.1 cell surface protein [Corynebacterium renale]
MSVTLVSPIVQPVALAQETTVTNGVASPQLVPDAIYAQGTWRQNYGYHGYAYVNKKGAANDLEESNESLVGNVIYLQYVTGRGEVSPIFYTVTDGQGRFSFDLSEQVTGPRGIPAFGLTDSDSRVRVWGENPDASKYSVVMAGDLHTGKYSTRLERLQESWNFTAGPDGSRITNGRFVLEEKPNHVGWLAKPENQWTTVNDAQSADRVGYGAISSYTSASRVWWESKETAGGGCLPTTATTPTKATVPLLV